MSSQRTALVVGATGATGSAVVAEMAKRPEINRVRLVVRREAEVPECADKNKFEQVIIEDFSRLADVASSFNNVDFCVCALGTTRAKAKADGFYKVDHDYCVETARLAKQAGCGEFHLVSSTGADPKSYFLYPKTKGQTEADITALGFSKLVIYRPGILLTPREESRPVEWVAQKFFGTLDYWRLQSIEVPQLARVIVNKALGKVSTPDHKPVEILGNSQIVELANKHE